MLNIPRHILRPARYTGIEPNHVKKGLRGVKVRFALCYPDVYEIGMSYYGLFLLYEIANNMEGVWCERCFAPWADMEDHLRKSSTPLSTLESRTPLHDMDMLGFSMTYELNVSNVLNMLGLGGVSIRAEERERGPIVVGGGPLLLNPKPYEAFFDLIVTGEGDGVLPAMIAIARDGKGEPRHRLIGEMTKLEGVYSASSPKKSVKRLFVSDLDSAYHSVRPPIPTVDSVHNRLNIEISRGCGNGCRFCMAGFGYRPYRERSFGAIKAAIDEGIEQTGYEEISLLSLSSGDHSCLFEVLEHAKTKHRGLSVSLPSLKIGSITDTEIASIGSMARTGFTFALEASTADLRCRLNKDIDVNNLVRQLPVLKNLGWRRLKLYLMVGFPWEREEDLSAIRDVIAPFRAAGMDVNLSVSPFIPKPHTPFQWLPMDDADTLIDKIGLIKDALKKQGVRVRYRDPAVSIVEGIVARGDGHLTGLFEHLHGKGVRLEAWREFFSFEPYRQWFEMNDIGTEKYTGSRKPEEHLPWDIVDNGFGSSFLAKELEKAGSGETTADCLTGCAGCGLGCHPIGVSVDHKAPVKDDGLIDLQDRRAFPDVETPALPPVKFTFRYGKYGDARYIGHLDVMNILLRAMKASGIVIRTRGKYHPLPKIAMSDALPVGVESTCELIEIETEHGRRPDQQVLRRINARLPAGLKIYDLIEGPLRDVVKDYLFILVGDREPEGEFVIWRRSKRDHFFLWRGAGIKQIWLHGGFKRIVKIESRRINGI